MPTGLVGYWPLDGDGTEQLGEYGLTGVVENGEWVSGRHGLAFESDGDDAIVVVDPDGTNIGLNSELMMVLAWILPAEVLGDTDSDIIMNKEDVFEYGLGHADLTGALQGAFGPCWRWWGTVVLPLAEWTHAAAGIDGANEVHYVNGALAESTECPGVLTSNDHDLRIGARGGDAASRSFFHGAIDDVMLFSGGLAADGVASVYQALLGGGTTSNFWDGSSASHSC